MLYDQNLHNDDRSQLIRDNIYLVDILVGRMVTQVPSFMNKDDMKSAGMVGLLDASNKFDPSKILEMEDNNREESYYIKQMKLYLEDKDYNCAKKILSEYKKLEGVSFLDSFPYSICINYPFVYKNYRKICYGDEIK